MSDNINKMPDHNYQFNRIEHAGRHEYISDFSAIRSFEKTKHEGYIKCKLFHGEFGSLIVPDQLYFEKKTFGWIQPLYFGANLLEKNDKDIKCTLFIDISFGVFLEVHFSNNDFLKRLSDHSELYKCTIFGPANISAFFTGIARWKAKYSPQIKLFHHTKEETIEKIVTSSYFLSSSWNIQGNKKLNNIAYVYFTSINQIKFDEDLHQIAMSSNSKLGFRVDQNSSNTPDLILEVYRESTKNRRHTIEMWVDSDLLAAQPVYKHSPPMDSVYYEIVQPFTHRVGLKPGDTLKIAHDMVECHSLKRLGYVVMGDATTVLGLLAPYDEENTPEILKIEDLGSNRSHLEFWFDNSNKDHFSGKVVEKTETLKKNT